MNTNDLPHRPLHYTAMREWAKPISALIDAMQGEWDRHGPLATLLRDADVVIGVDPVDDIGGILFGAPAWHNNTAGKVLVFTVHANTQVPGTGGGNELDFLHAAIIAVKELPLEIEGVEVAGS